MKLTCFFLLIFFIPFAYSAGTSEIFNNWSLSGTYETKNHINFTIYINSGNFDTLFEIQNKTAIVNNGSCNFVEPFTLCVYNVTFGYLEKNTFQRHYKGKVKISMKIPRLYANMSMPASILMGDSFDLLISFGNKGTMDATDFFLKETFPEKMVSVISSTCPVFGNKLEWKGTLNPGSRNQCLIKLKSIASGKFDSKAEISYFDGVEKKTLAPIRSINFIDHGLTIKQTFSKDKIEANTDLLYSAEIEAKKNISAADITLEFPEGLDIIAKPENITQSDGKFNLISRNYFGKRIFSFKLLPNKTGNMTATIKADYMIEDVTNLIISRTSTTVFATKPEAKIYANLTKGKGSFYIINLGKMAFRDISVNYSVNGEKKYEFVRELLPNTHKEIQVLTNNSKADITGIMYYQSQYGQQMKGNFTLQMKQADFKAKTTVTKPSKKAATGTSSGDDNTIKEESLISKIKSKNGLIMLAAFAIVIIFFIAYFKQKITRFGK